MGTVAPTRFLGGIEVEYGYAWNSEIGRLYGHSDLEIAVAAVVNEAIAQATGRQGSTIAFLRNGSKLYIDIGTHPEHATPETSDPLQTIVYERAGDRLLQNAIEAIRLRHKLETPPIYLYRSNLDRRGNGHACHENYLMDREVSLTNQVVPVLATFLVVRTIFTGTGHVGLVDRPGAKYPMVISPRLSLVEEVMSARTTKSRPLINTRDQQHSEWAKYRRLHVIPGDTSISDTAAALKVGSTSLVRALIECGMAPDVELVRPVQSARKLNSDLFLKDLLETNCGPMHPIEINRRFLIAARKMLDAFGYDCIGGEEAGEWVMRAWGESLNVLEHWRETGEDKSEGSIDWLSKLRLLDRVAKKLEINPARIANRSGSKDGREKAIDQLFHASMALHGITKKAQDFRQSFGISDFVTEVQVEVALRDAPMLTRAAFRQRVFDQFGPHGLSDWDEVRVSQNQGRLISKESGESLKLANPFRPNAHDLSAASALTWEGNDLFFFVHRKSLLDLKTPESDFETRPGYRSVGTPFPAPAQANESREIEL